METKTDTKKKGGRVVVAKPSKKDSKEEKPEKPAEVKLDLNNFEDFVFILDDRVKKPDGINTQADNENCVSVDIIYGDDDAKFGYVILPLEDLTDL